MYFQHSYSVIDAIVMYCNCNDQNTFKNEFCISKLKYKSISVLKLAIVTLVFSTNNLIQL